MAQLSQRKNAALLVSAYIRTTPQIVSLLLPQKISQARFICSVRLRLAGL